MPIKYLFRFDGAKDNDEFFNSARGRGISNVYAGFEMEIGPGWIPDFLLVSRDDAKGHCTLTLIELESRRMDALVSSRKYLPESSTEIFKTFHNYLGRVLAQCRSTADPRISVVEDLQGFLGRAEKIVIETACALRSDPAYLECLPLADQPQVSAVRYSHSSGKESFASLSVSPLAFEGHLILTRDQTVGLNRAIVILDAVVRQHEHSAARLKAWLAPNRNPLRKAISNRHSDFPELWQFLSTDKNSGVKITCEPFFSELSVFWSSMTDRPVAMETVHRLISEYYPLAYELKMGDRMQDVFKEAKRIVQRAPSK